MARPGRPKRRDRVAAAATENKVETAATLPMLPETPEVKDEKLVVSAVVKPKEVPQPKVKKVEEVKAEPVSVIIPTAEPVKKIEEPVVTTSESFIEELPKIEPEPVAAPAKEEKKPVVQILKDKPDSRNLEYPSSTIPVISKLKREPAYSRLTDAALLRIASSKLRSRYFFS